MTENEKEPQKKNDLEENARWLLLIGVVSSVLVMVIGIVVFIINPGTHSITQLQADALNIGDLPSTLAIGDPVAIIDLGILMLIATPVLRVMIVTGTLMKKGEWDFVALGIFVLLVLFTSFILASIRLKWFF